MLVIEGKEYILTYNNEDRLARRLHALYPPDQIVEEWVDGRKVDEIRLIDIFNK
jgi:hypothetical protein